MEKGPLFEIRGSLVEDEAQILEISRHLNTVNLPEEEEGVRQILEASQKSFTKAVKDPKQRHYVFVLVDRTKERIIGTSMVFAQLGRKDAPYIYLDVIDEDGLAVRRVAHRVAPITSRKRGKYSRAIRRTSSSGRPSSG